MKPFTRIIAALALGMTLGNSPRAVAGLTLNDFSSSNDGITYIGGGSGSQVIPDNTPVGVGYSINFGDSGVSIGNITVSLNLSGGYNGDIYAYLSHGSQNVVLLNQITGAANTSGFNVTLVEGTGNPIQTAPGTAGTALSGTTFTANEDLSAFNSTDANGAWTIFFADRNPGDTSTLTGFSLDITAVPEPINAALGIFGGVMGLIVLARSKPVKLWCEKTLKF